MRTFWVYILASDRNGTLYTGVTNNLVRRVHEHKEKLKDGFTNRYNIASLVYFEEHTTFYEAVEREKNIKKWNREWKINLIQKENPYWHDLYDSLI